MCRTLIQKDASSVINNFIERARVLGGLKHKPTKGTLKELFMSDVLKQLLTIQFGVGSGIVVNKENKQSRQTDIVIYDNRIIPPFISGPSIGVYPVESVIATIEVKTRLNKEELMDAEKAAKQLSENVVGEGDRPPLYAVFGFEGGIRGLETQEKGVSWFEKQNIQHIFNMCIAGKYCWADVGGKGWQIGKDTSGVHDETKRFLALVLDNVRTLAECRFRFYTRRHRDWLSGYIRG
jgi:hypothetical protein